MYVNNWLKSPRGFPILTVPGEDYPSGGPTFNMLSVWKAAAPSIDILAPDIYVLLHRPLSAHHHGPVPPPPWTGHSSFQRPTASGDFPGSEGNARNLFMTIEAGAIGFSPFGLDAFTPEENGKPNYEQQGLADSVQLLLRPMSAKLARLQFAGAVATCVQRLSASRNPTSPSATGAHQCLPRRLLCQRFGDHHPLTHLSALHMGRVLVAQLRLARLPASPRIDRPRPLPPPPRQHHRTNRVPPH